jgi:hypothetical protein
MAAVAIELNDAAFAVARDGAVEFPGPGYAALDGGRLVFGEAARALLRSNPRQSSRRHWAALAEAALPQPLGPCRSVADLVQRHLAALLPAGAGAGGPAALAVPPAWTPAQLGLLLGLAHEIPLAIGGLVDSAVAASRRPYPGRVLWHVEANLDTAWVTRIEQGEGALLGARTAVPRLGIEALERGCAELVARRFVACSRFDPLHHARSEQLLHDALPGWLAAAARQDAVEMALDHAGNRFEATLEARELRERVARLCEPLTRLLRSVVSPREPSVIQLHHRLADFPGVVEALLALPAASVVLLEPGAAARGALRLRAAGGDGGYALATALAFDQPPGDLADAAPVAGAAAPTHVVFEGRAWRLGAEPLQIGTELDAGEHGIRLDARWQAVSRRHCALRLEAGRVLVYDQSRYGTLLNGHRVAGSAVLQAGDVLGIGQPPREFALVAEVAHGA